MEGSWGGQGSESISHVERARRKDVRGATAEADEGQATGPSGQCRVVTVSEEQWGAVEGSEEMERDVSK